MWYRWNGRRRTTVWVTSRMEQGDIQRWVRIERNKEIFSVGSGGMEQLGLQFGVPVEWNRELFIEG